MYILYLKLICSNTYVKKKSFKKLSIYFHKSDQTMSFSSPHYWQPPIKEENQFWPLSKMYQHFLEWYFNSYMHVYITTWIKASIFNPIVLCFK